MRCWLVAKGTRHDSYAPEVSKRVVMDDGQQARPLRLPRAFEATSRGREAASPARVFRKNTQRDVPPRPSAFRPRVLGALRPQLRERGLPCTAKSLRTLPPFLQCPVGQGGLATLCPRYHHLVSSLPEQLSAGVSLSRCIRFEFLLPFAARMSSSGKGRRGDVRDTCRRRWFDASARNMCLEHASKPPPSPPPTNGLLRAEYRGSMFPLPGKGRIWVRSRAVRVSVRETYEPSKSR